MKKVTETFGRTLLSKIKQRDTHQTRFAEEINVKDASVTQWIKGKAYPNKENLIKLCDALDWDRQQATNMIEQEKKQCALLENGAEPRTLEAFLMDFCRLLQSQASKILAIFDACKSLSKDCCWEK